MPSTLEYKDAKIQLLDLPGIIEGAAEGKGRGKQVINVARTSDLILMMLDAGKGEVQKHLLQNELEVRFFLSLALAASSNRFVLYFVSALSWVLLAFHLVSIHVPLRHPPLYMLSGRTHQQVGIRLNQKRPNLNVVQKAIGGIKFNATVPLTHLNEGLVKTILHEYRIHNAEILVREDATVDQFLDVVEGNRIYMRCLYVYNKIDTITIEEVDRIAHQEDSVVLSCTSALNIEFVKEMIWVRCLSFSLSLFGMPDSCAGFLLFVFPPKIFIRHCVWYFHLPPPAPPRRSTSR